MTLAVTSCLQAPVPSGKTLPRGKGDQLWAGQIPQQWGHRKAQLDQRRPGQDGQGLLSKPQSLRRRAKVQRKPEGPVEVLSEGVGSAGREGALPWGRRMRVGIIQELLRRTTELSLGGSLPRSAPAKRRCSLRLSARERSDSSGVLRASLHSKAHSAFSSPPCRPLITSLRAEESKREGLRLENTKQLD